MRIQKLLAFALSLLLAIGMIAAGAAAEDDGTGPNRDDVYVVAGNQADIFGEAWNPTLAANQMNNSGGVYTKSYTVTQAYEDVQIKVVKNGTDWYGYNGENVQFRLTGPGTFTVAFVPSTGEVTVGGSIAFYPNQMDYSAVYVTGNGYDKNWLDNLNWNATAAAMTQVQTDVWQAELQVPAGSGFEMKFTVDGSWTRNFGGTFSDFGTETTAAWGGNNISFSLDEATTITVLLDLRNFNYADQTGAKFKISKPRTTFTVTSCQYSTNGVTGDSEGGSIRLKSPVDYMNRPQYKPAGTEFTFTVTQYRGYEMTLTALDESNNPVPMTQVSATVNDSQGNTTYLYSMNIPASDVTVLAEFTGERLYRITLKPSLYSPGASTSHVCTEEEAQAVIGTLSITPEYANAGETVTVTIVPAAGYFIKHDLMSYEHFGNTLTQTGDHTYTFVVPDYAAQHSGTRNIVLSTAFATGFDEGVFLQIDGAEQTDWIYMNHENLFEVAGIVDNLWQTRQNLTAGQVLSVYYVSNPGADPILKDTRTVTADDLADGVATVYYLNNGSTDDKIELSCLNGYYISLPAMDRTRWNSTWPYITDDSHAFKPYEGEGWAYYTDEYLKAGDTIKVARFVNGTVEEICCSMSVPYTFPVGDTYAWGRVFFDPTGNDGDPAMAIKRFHTVTVEDGIQNGEVTASPAMACEGETVVLTAVPEAGYALETLTATYTDVEEMPVEIPVTQDGTRYTFIMPEGDVTVSATFAEAPAFKTQNLLLSGQIGVNFYLDLSMLTDAQKADSYMTFGISGKGTTTDRCDYNANATNSSGYYKFTCYVNSLQMADTITATFHYGDNLTVSKDYSIKQYMFTFDEYINSFSEKQAAMVKSIADYGHYVQLFLKDEKNFTLGNGEDQYAEMDKFYAQSYNLDEVRTAVASCAAVLGTNADIEKVTFSLLLDSDTAIKVYIKPASGYTGSVTATVGAGTENVAVLQSDGRYLVTISGISAHKLGKIYKVTVTTDSGTAITKVSGLSYVQMLLNHSAYADKPNALNAMAAVYYYYKAVYDYRNG